MKTKIYSIITTFFFVCLGLKAANIVTMNKPEIILASSKSDNENISIEKVELTDTATILSIKYTKDPGSSLYIGKHIRLIGQDEKSYALRSAEGIEIAKTTTVPKSGSLEYRLFFEPMPKNTHYFDFLQKFPDTYNIFGIHDSSYKMSFPAISSYDTKSEAIISTEEFFKSGIGTLIVNNQNANSLVSPFWPDNYICTPFMLKTLTDSSEEVKGNFKIQTFKINTNYSHFSTMEPSIEFLQPFTFFIKPGKTTEVTIYNNGEVKFSKFSPMGNLCTMLTWFRCFWWDKVESKIGYLVKRFHLMPEEIHALQRLIDKNKIVKKIYEGNEDDVEDYAIKGNFVKKKVCDFYPLRKLQPNDLTYQYWSMEGYLMISSYEEVLIQLFANNKRQILKKDELALVKKFAEADKQIFQSDRSSTLLQLLLLDKSSLSHAYAEYCAYPEKSDFNQMIELYHNLIWDKQIRRLFDAQLDEIRKSENKDKVKTLDIFDENTQAK